MAVPTWNYTAVHAYGIPRILSDKGAVLELLRDQVAFFEAGFEQPWSTDVLPVDWLTRMASAVVAFEIELTRVEAKSKLSQNRPADQLRISAELERLGDATGVAVASAMRDSHASR